MRLPVVGTPHLAAPSERTSDASATPLLQVDNLTKLYPLAARWFRSPGFTHAVRDVSLFLHANETLGIVGESGSGKSTLAKLVLCLMEPDYGQVAFEGRLLTGLSERTLAPIRHRIQPVFQNARKAIDPLLTIFEVVKQGVDVGVRMAPGKTTADLATGWLTRVGLSSELHSRKPDALSEGELQRVALARALAARPKLLVLDEPVNSLDVSVRAQLLNLLLDLQGELGLSYLFISHDVRVVAYMSHRMAVMHAGSIVETGPTRELSRWGMHPLTRSLLGHSSTSKPHIMTHLGTEASRPGNTTGCAFQARCPERRDRCLIEAPSLEEVVPGSTQLAACHFPREEPHTQPASSLNTPSAARPIVPSPEG